ncbi:disulfide bond formation protein B [Alterisphingorhabdus coralli]|uniref:Disulfide bond formation protein B n=1 Tax=Alterisphingorhabdus coralli TaxID=3071408 RepID=A0AA97I137_9SPHN|nr:disulfide bond formation protein B [Parasphingorhabdus sp. SCSIO 66989]WOE74865.1 disulfide bond formation protein B [Parasphingorhabdus sp. SCSIO 66989]
MSNKWASLLAFVLPLGLIAGALISEYGFGLFPCEMCMWQRWPHYAAIVLGGLALVLNRSVMARPLTLLAALAILISGTIGGFHAGVEYGWWEGITSCASGFEQGLDAAQTLDAIMDAPIVRCDTAPWSVFGISLAGFNFLFSVFGAIIIFMMARSSKGA